MSAWTARDAAAPTLSGSTGSDQQEAPALAHAATAVRQDGDRPSIVEAVDDTRQDVQVRALRHAREHVTTHHLATLGHARLREQSRRTLDDARQVQQNAT